MSDLLTIKGIGNKSLKLLEKLNINTIEELVMHYPFRYNLYRNMYVVEGLITIDAIIESSPTIFRFGRNKNKMSFRINNGDKVINAILFNRAFMKNSLEIGTSVIITGNYDELKNTIVINNIKLGRLGDSVLIEPVYHTVKGLSIKNINTYIKNALEEFNILNVLPEEIIEKNNFSDRMENLKVIHNPESMDMVDRAVDMFKYEELFLFMMKINYLKLNREEEVKGLSRDIMSSDIESFVSTLPFKLTADQVKVTGEIIDDLNNAIRMNRILEGDVGSGKTVVGVIGIYGNYLSGYQSALMVPTEVLAIQHFNTIKELLSDTDMVVELLTSSTKNKSKIYGKLEAGEIDLIIGTHALIQDKVLFSNLGFIITDEQHRFGVNQRKKLQNKGIMPDILYMSATPIPRTYALSIYGDMDISIIKTKPIGRKDIITYLKKPSEIKDILLEMYRELNNGKQIYVVAPLIEESEEIDATNVYELEGNLKKAFKKQKIAVMHGKMKSDEKEKVMDYFKKGKIDILISTTVIEVGVDNKNASMMVIFDADRFGLSQLHQLRGRVGRSDIQSYCILVSDKEKERLDVLVKTNDGFLISEADFKLRGAGNLFGVEQSGDMIFKVADIKKDYDILIKAKEDSMKMLKSDWFKKLDKNIYLKTELKKINNLN